jgi:hypothetical protein
MGLSDKLILGRRARPVKRVLPAAATGHTGCAFHAARRGKMPVNWLPPRRAAGYPGLRGTLKMKKSLK